MAASIDPLLFTILGVTSTKEYLLNNLFRNLQFEKSRRENWREIQNTGQKIEKVFCETDVADGTLVGWAPYDGENWWFLIIVNSYCYFKNSV